jgi:hypothetical protein
VKPDPSNFFVTGGALSSDAPSYVERQADRELVEALHAGEFCYVLTARQMGKSSLMVRAVSRLRAEGIDAAVVDLTAIGLHVSVDQWYRGILTELSEQLGLESAFDAHWHQHANLAPTHRWLRVLRDVFGSGRSRPLVIFFDEIDAVRSLPFRTDDFFAGIRELYNRRARESDLRLVSFCLIGVASPGSLIPDPMLTPFNIGRRIELTDFTPVEASRLAEGLGRPPAVAGALLARVLFWTGAHPYLTQRLCQAVALNEMADVAQVDSCCHELFLSPHARERDDNLIFVREHLLAPDGIRTALLDLYASVLRGRAVRHDERSNPLVDLLQLSGIVTGDASRLRVRNRIYEQVFDRAWVKENLPDAEIRRQRAAFRRGVARAGVLSAIIVAALVAFSSVLLRERNLLRAEQAHSRQLLYAAEINLAGQAWEAGNASRVATLLAHNLPVPGGEDLRGFEWFHLWWLVHGDPRALVGSVRSPTKVRFSPDGRSLATSGWNGKVDLWDVASNRLRLTLPTDDQVHILDVAF